VVLALIVIVSLFTVKWLFGIVVIIALLIAVREFVDALAGRGIRIARTPVYAAAVILPALAYVGGLALLATGFGVIILLAMVWRVRRGTSGYVADVTASGFIIAYLPFRAGFLMITLAADNGPARVVVFILLTVSNDIGGY
jgi:phosphatidate cytidylyltransferase